MFHYHWDEFQTHVFHVVPSMDLIVLVVNLYGQKPAIQKQTNQLRMEIPL